MKVRELLSDETKWTRGALARNAQGIRVAPDASDATAWCVIGALRRCYGRDPTDAYDRLLQAVGYESVLFWNDEPIRGFTEVKALVNALDI